jgi:hypothetical protein
MLISNHLNTGFVWRTIIGIFLTNILNIHLKLTFVPICHMKILNSADKHISVNFEDKNPRNGSTF